MPTTLELRSARYIQAKDVARLIRAALRHRFPGRKFSVRTSLYAGGATVYVGFPHVSDADTNVVRRLCGQFSGKEFHGSIDLAFPLYHWLSPTPAAAVAYTPGTIYSGGLFPEHEHPKPCEDAELVCFGCTVSVCAEHAHPF